MAMAVAVAVAPKVQKPRSRHCATPRDRDRDSDRDGDHPLDCFGVNLKFNFLSDLQVRLRSPEMAALTVVADENVATDPHGSSSKATFNVGSRKSKLALIQTNAVVSALSTACPDNAYVVKARDTAAGDIDKLTPFKDMPVKNLWTHELETLMVEGQLDFLVHSLKGWFPYSRILMGELQPG